MYKNQFTVGLFSVALLSFAACGGGENEVSGKAPVAEKEKKSEAPGDTAPVSAGGMDALPAGMDPALAALVRFLDITPEMTVLEVAALAGQPSADGGYFADGGVLQVFDAGGEGELDLVLCLTCAGSADAMVSVSQPGLAGSVTGRLKTGGRFALALPVDVAAEDVADVAAAMEDAGLEPQLAFFPASRSDLAEQVYGFRRVPADPAPDFILLSFTKAPAFDGALLE